MAIGINLWPQIVILGLWQTSGWSQFNYLFHNIRAKYGKTRKRNIYITEVEVEQTHTVIQQTNLEVAQQHELLPHQQHQEQKGHMQWEHNYVQDAEKLPTTKLKIKREKLQGLHILEKTNLITSPGISIGNAAKDNIISDADIATVFLSTTTNPMFCEWWIMTPVPKKCWECTPSSIQDGGTWTWKSQERN